MNTQLILALIPLADKLIFSIGGKLMELNTESITKEELIAALEESRSANWPELKFISTMPEEE